MPASRAMPAAAAKWYPMVAVMTVLPCYFGEDHHHGRPGKQATRSGRRRLAKLPAVMLIQQPAWSAPAYRQGKTSNENDCLPARHHLRDRRRDVFRDASRPIADFCARLLGGFRSYS